MPPTNEETAIRKALKRKRSPSPVIPKSRSASMPALLRQGPTRIERRSESDGKLIDRPTIDDDQESTETEPPSPTIVRQPLSSVVIPIDTEDADELYPDISFVIEQVYVPPLVVDVDRNGDVMPAGRRRPV